MADQNLEIPSTSEEVPLIVSHIKSNFVGDQIMADQKFPSASETVKNIVLVGRTGNGKSATGNCLIGKQVFNTETKATVVTTRCETYTTVTPSGLRINVIDTPGLFDMSESAEDISKEITKCLKLVEGGLHVIVLVLSVRTRFTQEEVNTLSILQVLFGNQIFEYLVIVFTGGDELEAKNQTLGDYLLQGCPEVLKEVLRRCGYRIVMFNNMTRDKVKKDRQVQKFLALVAKIKKRTHGKPFKGEMQCKIEETESLRQQQKAVEASSNLGETELTEMKDKTKLIETSAEHKKMVSKLDEDLEKVRRENINLLKEKASEQNRRMICEVLEIVLILIEFITSLF